MASAPAPSPACDARGTTRFHGVVVKAQSDAALASAARIHALTLVLRAGHPVLLALATRSLGLASYGAFLASQGLVFVLARLALAGLDRALLVTAPKLARAGAGMPLGRAGAIVLASSSIGAVVVGLGIAATVPAASSALVVIAGASVVPVALVELFAHAAIARGRFTQATLVREALAPTLAIALVFLPFWPHEGGVAFAASFALATSLAAIALGLPLLFDEAVDLRVRPALPTRVTRAARGALFADGVATLTQRLDVVVLALVAAPPIVGAYGVVMQFAQTLRGLRAGLEPVVQKRVAERDAEGVVTSADDASRSARAAALRFQIPLALAFVVLAEPLLAFFGVHARAEDARQALYVLVLGQLASTPLAFEMAILHGRGRGRSVAMALLAGALAQAALFVTLVPVAGLLGAAVAAAIATNVPGAIAALLRRAPGRAGDRPVHEVLS